MADTAVLAKDKAFLGREFLTWLWFRSEVDGGEFDLGNGEEPVAVLFDDGIVLASPEDPEQVAVRRASPHASAEARTALLVGKTVERAKLQIARGDREWRLTVVGDTLDLRSVKVPDPDPAERPDDLVLYRLGAFEEAFSMVDGLYGLFLAARLGEDWETREVRAVSDWVRRKALPSERAANEGP